MLSDEEKGFLEYWEINRLRKRKVWKQLAIGLPAGVAIVVAIFINLFSGWDKKADMAMQKEKSSLIIVLVIASLLIVAFSVIFSARHRWDMDEQHYKELMAKKDKP